MCVCIYIYFHNNYAAHSSAQTIPDIFLIFFLLPTSLKTEIHRLDAALIYVGIDLPRSDQELRQLCGITSSSTVTVTSTSLPSLPEVVPEPEPPEPAPNPPEATETAATAATAGSEAGTAGSGAETAGTGENSLSVQSVAEPSTPSSADAPNITNTSTSTATTTLFVTETETSTVTATVTETTTHTVTESTTASTTTLAAFGTVDTVLDGASGADLKGSESWRKRAPVMIFMDT